MEAEKPTIDFAFASVVTIKNIKRGERFSKENIWVKRPGTGDFKADKFNDLIGMVAARDIQKDSLLTRNDVAGEIS